MYQLDICHVLQSNSVTKNKLLGVFMQDQLHHLKTIKPGQFAIVNNQSSWQGGQHWFAVFCVSAGRYQIFDSTGFSEQKRVQWLKCLKGRFFYNTARVQPHYSNFCAAYCIIFAIERYLKIHLGFADVFTSAFHPRDWTANEYLACTYLNNKCRPNNVRREALPRQ